MPTRTSRALKGSVTGIIQNVLAILFQLFLTPMILIYSGQAMLGGYAIIMQVIGYSILLDFGFSTAFTRYLCQAFDSKENFHRFSELLTVGRNILFITNFLASLLLVIAALNIEILVRDSDTIQSQAKFALYLMAIWMLLRTPLYIYNTALTATQDMAATNVISVGTNLIRLLIALALTYFGFGLLGLIIATILAELCQYAIQRAYFFKNYPIYPVSWGGGNSTIGKEMLYFGFGYWGVNLAVVFLLSSDSIIAGTLYGAASASVFYSTKMLGSLVIQFISRLIDNIYPALNEMIGKNNHSAVRSVYLRLLRYILLLSIPATLAIAIFSKSLVTLWVGEKQYAGPIMAIALALFVFIQILNHLHGLMTIVLGNLRHWSQISIACGLLSFGLGYSMGKFMGIQWILFGITLAMLPIFVLLVYRVVHELEIALTEVVANVLPAIFACMPLLAIIWINELIVVVPTLLNVTVTLIIYLLIWVSGTWFFGINNQEKIQVQLLFSRFFKKA